MYMLDDETVLGMYMYVQPDVVLHYAPSTRYNSGVAAPRTDAESACFTDPSKYYGGGRHAITYYHYCGIVPPPSRGEGPSSRDTPVHVRLTLGVGSCPPVVVVLLHRLLRNLVHIRVNASRKERQGKTQNKDETKYEIRNGDARRGRTGNRTTYAVSVEHAATTNTVLRLAAYASRASRWSGSGRVLTRLRECRMAVMIFVRFS